MARKSTSKPVSTSKPALKAKAPATKERPEQYSLGCDPDVWLHGFTNPLAYPAPSNKDLFDVWQVNATLGEIERVAAAVSADSSPLILVRDYYWNDKSIAFLTPHIEGDEAEYFLQMVCQCAAWLRWIETADCDATEHIPPSPVRKEPAFNPFPELAKQVEDAWPNPDTTKPTCHLRRANGEISRPMDPMEAYVYGATLPDSEFIEVSLDQSKLLSENGEFYAVAKCRLMKGSDIPKVELPLPIEITPLPTRKKPQQHSTVSGQVLPRGLA